MEHNCSDIKHNTKQLKEIISETQQTWFFIIAAKCKTQNCIQISVWHLHFKVQTNTPAVITWLTACKNIPYDEQKKTVY